MRIAILAHEQFPNHAKTAIGILRYSDHNVVAVLDRTKTGERVCDYVSDVQDAPIIEEMSQVSSEVDALSIGIAPIGGGFDSTWRSDIQDALVNGCDIINGLHYFLEDDKRISRLADEHNCESTDCSSGKMTTSFELLQAARDQGIDAAVIPTGQTGVMITDRGIVVDGVISDFAAGAVERMIKQVAAENDLIIVEGQGSIAHPAYSGVTTSILHGAMPDGLILCHAANREAIRGYDHISLPPIDEYIRTYEQLSGLVSPAKVVAGAINTHHIEEAKARTAVADYAAAIDAPATDPVRFDATKILNAVLK
jgi:uncharacterized NAD-dependent epimerase/dehydratase family protein